MKLQIVTDVHLEFGAFDMDQTGEVLLLPGDIMVAAHIKRFQGEYDYFFKTVCARYDNVYMICGNHEYYNSAYYDVKDDINHYLRDTNVHLLDNEVVALTDKTRMFAGTFWTDLNKGDPNIMFAIKRYMNDYRIISGFSPEFQVRINQNARDALAKAINDVDIIMTHHGLIMPPTEFAGPNFSNDGFDYGYFNTGLEEMIADSKVKLLIHGHTHDQYDYMWHGKRIVVNPRGYKGHGLNPDFVPGLAIEVD